MLTSYVPAVEQIQWVVVFVASKTAAAPDPGVGNVARCHRGVVPARKKATVYHIYSRQVKLIHMRDF